MRLSTTKFERLPMVCLLVGLLSIAAGLYLGFEHSLAFTLMIVGFLCCAFGTVLFALHLLERPKKSAATRLSPEFISAGATTIMPAMPSVEDEQATERSAVE